jgi:tubulin polyglutamylase TTLL6/13
VYRNAIYKVLPSEFQFFPRTFLIPAESVELQAAMENGPKNATYIVKPRTLCQGKGISLIQSFAKLPTNEPCVVQRYGCLWPVSLSAACAEPVVRWERH